VLAVGGLLWGYRGQQALVQVLAEQRLLSQVLARPGALALSLPGPEGEPLGSVLLDPGGEALFVLSEPAPPGRAYQAWGHRGDDWQRDRDQITSLAVNRGTVLAVSWRGFGSLYLSLEPAGGSALPTQPLSRVSLAELINRPPERPLDITSPAGGAVLSADRVIVSGRLQGIVSGLRYTLNGGEATETAVSGTRFSFTVAGLRAGENTVTVSATDAAGNVVTDSVTVSYNPP
jgi:hypothetical protein